MIVSLSGQETLCCHESISIRVSNVMLDPNLSWSDHIGRKFRQSSASFVKRERSFRVIRA